MYDLDRFLTAQRRDYAAALREIQNGRKRSHWIWYIFPQVAGLGMSSTSQYYAISGLDEARAYLREPTLRAHLREFPRTLRHGPGALTPIELIDHAPLHYAIKCHNAVVAGEAP